ncbi:MAG: DUF2203 domain-containing protein [Thermoplasmata archaeon]|nr:DUF2203 domain-containing protein [Thermoplasmata archaeon]
MAEREASADDLPQPSRLWTLNEANERLEGLREQLPRLRAWVVRMRKVHEERQRLADFWGKEVNASDHPDAGLRTRLEEEGRTITENLEREVGLLKSEGIEVKDLESGLVDFYALEQGEVVFLCWQRGEEEVGFFHTLDGGYRTRRPLPDKSNRPATRTHHRAA